MFMYMSSIQRGQARQVVVLGAPALCKHVCVVHRYVLSTGLMHLVPYMKTSYLHNLPGTSTLRSQIW